MDIKQIESAFVKIATILNDNAITWGLGGSLLLHYSGYDVTVSDIDIIIEEKDNLLLLNAIKNIEYTQKYQDGDYLTGHFYQLLIDSVSIDLMLSFKYRTPKGIYEFPFNKSLVASQFELNGTTVYLTNIAEWKRAYTALRREDKIKILA